MYCFISAVIRFTKEELLALRKGPSKILRSMIDIPGGLVSEEALTPLCCEAMDIEEARIFSVFYPHNPDTLGSSFCYRYLVCGTLSPIARAHMDRNLRRAALRPLQLILAESLEAEDEEVSTHYDDALIVTMTMIQRAMI